MGLESRLGPSGAQTYGGQISGARVLTFFYYCFPGWLQAELTDAEYAYSPRNYGKGSRQCRVCAHQAGLIR